MTQPRRQYRPNVQAGARLADAAPERRAKQRRIPPETVAYLLLGTGLVLACGSMIGAHFGARFTMARGNRAIRLILAAMVMVSAAKLLWDVFRA